MTPAAPETLQPRLIHLALVGDLHAQPGDAGVDVHQVLPAAERRDDLLGLAVGDAAGAVIVAVAVPDRPRHGGGRVGALAEVGRFLGLELALRLAPGRAQVPLRDREPEQHVVDDEEHDAHADQQRDVLRRRSGAVEKQVDQAGGEREAQVDVEQVGDRQGQPGQHRVDEVQRERHEHERELERLGDAGQERGQRRRRQDADRDLALLLVRHVDHRQRGGGQPEHQDRVEARGEDARGAGRPRRTG